MVLAIPENGPRNTRDNRGSPSKGGSPEAVPQPWARNDLMRHGVHDA